MITSRTRVTNYSATLIDPILVTDPSKVIHADTLDIDPDISDHKATLLLLNFITIQLGCAKRRVWYYSVLTLIISTVLLKWKIGIS